MVLDFDITQRHPTFAGVAAMKPLTFEDGSHVAPFDKDKFVMRLSPAGDGVHNVDQKYTAGGNLFWTNMFFAPCPGVPINKTGAIAPTKTLHKLCWRF